MNIHTRAAALLLGLAASGAVTAQVQEAKPAPAPASAPAIEFLTVDKNADGRISKQEALAVTDLGTAFGALDADHDGWVTPAEFANWGRAARPKVVPPDPKTAPGGSAGAQHMPAPN